MVDAEDGTVSLASQGTSENVTRLVVDMSSGVVPQSARYKESTTNVRQAGAASFVVWNTLKN